MLSHISRRTLRGMGVFIALILIVPLTSATLSPFAAAQDDDALCFTETPYCISGQIRTFWEQNGGLPVFGFPITPQRPEIIEGEARNLQWFERNRIELHPQNPAPYDVLLGRSGVEWLEKHGRDWQRFPMVNPDMTPVEGCETFDTGYAVCGDFLTYYRAHGLNMDEDPSTITLAESLALFGMPISDEIPMTLHDGNTYTVQWFERARFEYHPENEPPFHVLGGLLTAEVYPLSLVTIKTMEVITEGTTATLHITGELHDGCTTIGSITNEREGNVVRVIIAGDRPSDAEVCPAILPLIDEYLQLPGDFPADSGPYTLFVNGMEMEFTTSGDSPSPPPPPPPSPPTVTPPALEDYIWSLQSYRLDGRLQLILEGTTVTAQFDANEQRVGGTSGCNQYGATYERDGNSLRIGPAMSTMMACDEAIMAQEQAYTSLLAEVAAYRIVGTTLELLDESGSIILIFNPLESAPLVGTEWRVTAYYDGNGFTSPISGTEMTAIFDNEGALSGSSGCNTYHGSYQVSGNALTIGTVASTRMMCEEPEGVMEQEMLYLSALEMVEVYEIVGDVLSLRTNDGMNVVRYERTP